MPFERITIRKMDLPASADVNSELQWLGAVLGLFGERDKDSSCFRVFVTLVRASRAERTISSDAIANDCELTRGTVVHHLNKLRDAGVVEPVDHGYRLAYGSIGEMAAGLQDELDRLLSLVQRVADDLDDKLLPRGPQDDRTEED